jgi:general secretion pathway protein F
MAKEPAVQPVTLDQLIALNREIGALAAAGIPLGHGLVRVADELSGPSAALARRLAGRIEAGADLAAALDAESPALPESYRALVRAGLHSGNLAAAVEGYCDTALRMAELRRVVGLASLYPVLLVVAVWIFFLLASSVILPSFDWLGIGDHFWVEPLRISMFGPGQAGRWLLGLIVPVVLVLATILWWQRSARATEASSGGQARWLGWIPGLARTSRLSGEANFADMLQLLVSHGMPLTKALPLAAEASGLAQTTDAAGQLATQLAAGKPLWSNRETLRRLPPLVRLALATDHGPTGLVDGLRRAAKSYRRRANAWAEGIAFYLPLALTALVGGTVVGAYAILLFQPYAATLRAISQWQ